MRTTRSLLTIGLIPLAARVLAPYSIEWSKSAGADAARTTIAAPSFTLLAGFHRYAKTGI